MNNMYFILLATQIELEKKYLESKMINEAK
jgi:hypothetical protein